MDRKTVAVLATLFICLSAVFRRIVLFVQRVISHKRALGKVHSPKKHWFWGHISGKSPDEIMKDNINITKQFPKATARWIGPFVGGLGLYYPSLMQTILNSNEPKDHFVYNVLMKPWIGEGLLVSNGKKWKRNRRLLTGAFHFDMLKRYLVVFNETASTLCSKWKTKTNVSITSDVSMMSLDAILQCATSSKTNCQNIGKSHPYINAICELAEIVTQRFFNPFLSINFIFLYFTQIGRRFRKEAKIVHNHSEDVIRRRKTDYASSNHPFKDFENQQINGAIYKDDGQFQLDFLDILLLARDEKGKGLTDREIRDEVDTFLFEGHDTTASGISWALYNLARHPEIQERCRQEINQVLDDRNNIELEDLNKFEYLTMCIKESLRLHPPVFGISRNLSKPFHFNRDFGSDQLNTTKNPTPEAGQTFPPNLRVELRILPLHRNPNIWENPEVYDPERFTAENVAKRSSFAYVPFSAGPRNCIGQNFAMMEMKVALALCLKKFKIEVDENFPKPEIYPAVVLRSKNGIHLKLESL